MSALHLLVVIAVVVFGEVLTQAPPKPRTGCGKRNPAGVGTRGAGDENAKFAEFPWMVAVLAEEVTDGSTYNIYQCGGSLINLKVVLTAAHCVSGKDPKTLKIRAGDWDTSSRSESLPHQDRAVSLVIKHEDAGVDVALLVLATAMDPAENVGVVCLPQADAVFDRTRCFATGWGKNKAGKEGRYQEILKKVELPIVANPACQTALRKTALGPNYVLNKNFICAGGEANKATCKGDQGGPLVCPFKNDALHYQQAGVVTSVLDGGCAASQTPGVFVNLALIRGWINRKMADNHLDPASYTKS